MNELCIVKTIHEKKILFINSKQNYIELRGEKEMEEKAQPSFFFSLFFICFFVV
jgi:hypothetical protein